MSLSFANDEQREGELQWGAVYDLYGNLRSVSSPRSGIFTNDLRDWAGVEVDDVRPHDPEHHDPEWIALSIRLLRVLTLLKHKRSRRFTDTQLRTMYFLWLLDLSLHDVARLEGKWVQTVRERIEGTKGHGGLRKKAPKFYEWWSGMHSSRRGVPRRPRAEKGRVILHVP